ncbi:MAG: hypothetical protein M3O22_09165 [Pseudomonadota bacterium]|nr:hypothetical protein [Pseudomonadota bacterium]
MRTGTRSLLFASASALALMACGERKPTPWERADLLTTVVKVTPEHTNLTVEEWNELWRLRQKGIIGVAHARAARACASVLKDAEIIKGNPAPLGPEDSPENLKFYDSCARALLTVQQSWPPVGHILLRYANGPDWPVCVVISNGDPQAGVFPWFRSNLWGDSNLPAPADAVSDPETRVFLEEAGWLMQKFLCGEAPPATDEERFRQYMDGLEYVFDHSLGTGIGQSMTDLAEGNRIPGNVAGLRNLHLLFSLHMSLNAAQWSTGDLAPVALFVRALMEKQDAYGAGRDDWNGERFYANRFMEFIWAIAPRNRDGVLTLAGIHDTMQFLHSRLPQAYGQPARPLPASAAALALDENTTGVLRRIQRLQPWEQEMFREFLEGGMAISGPWLSGAGASGQNTLTIAPLP